MTRDITQQRADAEEACRETATLQSIPDAMPSVVAVVGADGHHRHVNRAFEQQSGRGRVVADQALSPGAPLEAREANV